MRKLLPFICIVLLITSSIFGTLFFLSSEELIDPLSEEDEVMENITPLRATVDTGIITSTITREGRVIDDSPETYIDIITVEFRNKSDVNNFKTVYSTGDELNKGDVLYVYWNKELKVASDFKIVDIVIDDTGASFTLLNYDELYIVTEIPLDQLDIFDFDTKTTISLTNRGVVEEYDGKIINFGYEVKEGNVVDILVRSKKKLLPGTMVKVNFEVSRQTDSMYILQQMLKKEGDSYYVEVERSDSSREHKNVEIGDFFDMYNDGEKIEFVEILSGLDAGEKLITDIIN